MADVFGNTITSSANQLVTAQQVVVTMGTSGTSGTSGTLTLANSAQVAYEQRHSPQQVLGTSTLYFVTQSPQGQLQLSGLVGLKTKFDGGMTAALKTAQSCAFASCELAVDNANDDNSCGNKTSASCNNCLPTQIGITSQAAQAAVTTSASYVFTELSIS